MNHIRWLHVLPPQKLDVCYFQLLTPSCVFLFVYLCSRLFYCDVKTLLEFYSVSHVTFKKCACEFLQYSFFWGLAVAPSTCHFIFSAPPKLWWSFFSSFRQLTISNTVCRCVVFWCVATLLSRVNVFPFFSHTPVFLRLRQKINMTATLSFT